MNKKIIKVNQAICDTLATGLSLFFLSSFFLFSLFFMTPSAKQGSVEPILLRRRQPGVCGHVQEPQRTVQAFPRACSVGVPGQRQHGLPPAIGMRQKVVLLLHVFGRRRQGIPELLRQRKPSRATIDEFFLFIYFLSSSSSSSSFFLSFLLFFLFFFF